nr:hypothetical protein Iba_chr05cCG7250 [Ipomoea batatas]
MIRSSPSSSSLRRCFTSSAAFALSSESFSSSSRFNPEFMSDIRESGRAHADSATKRPHSFRDGEFAVSSGSNS